MTLADRVAIITGAAGGIGRAIALELARHGARTVVVDVAEQQLEETAMLIKKAGGDAEVCVGDVSQQSCAERFVTLAQESYGRIDVLANNAGIDLPVTPIAECSVEDFDRLMAINLRGVFLGMRYALPVMIEQGSGSVVNTGSAASFVGFAGTGPYVASKHGVAGLTRTAAAEVGSLGIRVNAVCPGPVETRMARSLAAGFFPEDPDEGMRHQAQATPLKRFADPAEIAAVVRFLASDEASFVNGAAWMVDGGIITAR